MRRASSVVHALLEHYSFGGSLQAKFAVRVCSQRRQQLVAPRAFCAGSPARRAVDQDVFPVLGLRGFASTGA